MEKLALTEFGICLPIIQLISAFSYLLLVHLQEQEAHY